MKVFLGKCESFRILFITYNWRITLWKARKRNFPFLSGQESRHRQRRSFSAPYVLLGSKWWGGIYKNFFTIFYIHRDSIFRSREPWMENETAENVHKFLFLLLFACFCLSIESEEQQQKQRSVHFKTAASLSGACCAWVKFTANDFLVRR